MSKWDILVYLVSVALLLVILVFLIPQDSLTLLRQVSWADFSISIGITILLYTLSGLQYWYLMRQKNQVSLNGLDILLFPIAMNLWSYIIPFQGAFIFGVAFLKAKYQVRIAQGAAINIYAYLISLVLTGAIGLYLAAAQAMLFSLLALVSLAFILLPIAVVFLAFILNKMPSLWADQNRWLKKLQSFFLTIIDGISELWQDKKLTSVMFFFNVLHIVVSFIWYGWAAMALGLSIPVSSIVLLTLMVRASLIFKFTPGNWGVEQLISGGVSLLLQGSAADGILISLFTNLTSLVLILTLGSLSTIYNLRFFKISNFFALIKTLRSENK